MVCKGLDEDKGVSGIEPLRQLLLSRSGNGEEIAQDPEPGEKGHGCDSRDTGFSLGSVIAESSI